MKKTWKFSMIVVLLLCIYISLNTFVYAANPSILDGKITDPTDTTITTNLNKVLGVIQAIGTIGAVGILMVLGVRYMMGSVEEKASYKKSMLPYVIGAILVFSAVTVANVVYKMSQAI